LASQPDGVRQKTKNGVFLVKFRPPRVEALVAPYMIKKATGNTRRYDIFHPSAWGSCLRKIVFQYYNEQFNFLPASPRDVDLRMERVFDNGHGIHARWQDYLDKAGVLRGLWRCPNPSCGKMHGEGELLGIFNPMREEGFSCSCGNDEVLVYEEVTVRSEPEYNFCGNVDSIVDVRGTPHADGGNMDVFVVDMKSMKDTYFLELQHAKWEHVVQVHIYMWLLDLHAAVVLYECKDNQEIKEMFVPRDESIVERIKTEAKWLLRVIKRGKLPPRQKSYSQYKIPCRFCEFVGQCY
jgi:hypothetical protein